MRHLIYVIPTVIGLWILDNALALDRYGGARRGMVRKADDNTERQREASVIALGSSIAKDWLPNAVLAKVTGARPRDVVDAHIPGCHQACTWAQVRRLILRERRYRAAFFGVGQYQLCEHPHSKRVLQHQLLTPAIDVPRLFALYTTAEQPMQYMARYLGMSVLGSYGDTQPTQSRLSRALFGRTDRRRSHRWYRPRVQREEVLQSCAYGDADIAFKRAVMERLLDDLRVIAKDVFLMAVPDRTMGLSDPEHRRRWAEHMALLRALADARPGVHLVDLVTDGLSEAHHFRDGLHLAKAYMPRQRALLVERMAELGWPPPKQSAVESAR